MPSTLVQTASRIGCFIFRNQAPTRALTSQWYAILVACTILLTGSNASAQSSMPTAAKMLSSETQAMLVFPDSKRFLDQWKKTELGKLAADDKLAHFWDTQRQEIQDRFRDAGWQLTLDLDDLNDLSAGQTALGWISRPDVPAKAYSVALIIDVEGKVDVAEKFLQRIDQELKAKNAAVKSIDVSGTKANHYTYPKIPGETRARESFYAISKNQLLAADDVLTLTELLQSQDGNKEDSLANNALYQSVQSKIQSEDEPPELEYFVRPIGFAKLLRAVSGKPAGNQADILKILESQGFADLQCFAGNIQIATDQFNFFHNGYVIAKKPLSESVQILDFPNLAKLAAPSWIDKDSASVLSYSWNIAEAFPRFHGIVDAYVGKGTFDDVIKAIRDDPNGPQIDIVKEVLPFITTEFHIVTEIVKPIAPDSKRSMVILKLNDPDNKLPKVLERFGKSEPDAKEFDFEGYRIWRKKVEELEVEIDFDKDSSGKDADAEAEDEALLDEWAITIMDGYFIFASNADFITDTIRDAKNGAQNGAFAKEADVLRVNNMLQTIHGNEGHSFNQLTRSDLAFEMQYELFRQNILPKSQSILSTILDRLSNPKDPRKGKVQKIQGNALPPFAQVKDFFMPSGGAIRTEEDGWSIQSFILSK